MTAPALNGSVTSTAIANAAAGLRLFAHTVGSLANGCLVVAAIGTDSSGGTNTYTGATFNGIAMTAVASAVAAQANSDGSKTVIAFFVLTAAAGLTATTANVVISSSGATPLTGGYAANFDSVDQATPTINGANSGSATPNAAPAQAITNPTNNIAIGCCGAYDPFNNMAVGDIALGAKVTDGIFSAISFLLEYATTVNPSLDWTLTTAGTGGNGQCGFSLQGTGAGGDTLMGQASY